jgi:ABC-2 type transport system permease protein
MLQRIAAIIQKDTILRFSSRTELLFFLILPVIFTALLGGGVNFGDGDGDSRLRVPAVIEDSGPAAAALLDALAESATVRFEPMTRGEAEALLDDGDVSAILFIPDGYSEALDVGNLLAGGRAGLTIRSAPDSNIGLTVEQAVGQAVATFGRPLLVARASAAGMEEVVPFADDAARAAFFRRSSEAAEVSLAAQPSRVRFESASGDAEYDQGAQASAGQLITWVLIPLLGISALFASERTAGTLRRTVVTPTRRSTYLFGAISGQFLMALVQMAILVVFGIFILNVPWGQDPAALALVLVTFGLAAVAMGALLGTVTRSESQANNLSIMLGMAMALLGGCWWPQELFPPTMQAVTKVLPTTWAMQAMTDITMRGQGLEGVAWEAAVLVGFAVVFFVLAVWRFRYE